MTGRGDPYTTLGVDPTASTEQIHSAFRRAIRSLRPDHHGDVPADHMAITRVVEAWRLLGDPVRRADLLQRQATGPTARAIAGSCGPLSRRTGNRERGHCVVRNPLSIGT